VFAQIRATQPGSGGSSQPTPAVLRSRTGCARTRPGSRTRKASADRAHLADTGRVPVGRAAVRIGWRRRPRRRDRRWGRARPSLAMRMLAGQTVRAEEAAVLDPRARPRRSPRDPRSRRSPVLTRYQKATPAKGSPRERRRPWTWSASSISSSASVLDVRSLGRSRGRLDARGRWSQPGTGCHERAVLLPGCQTRPAASDGGVRSTTCRHPRTPRYCRAVVWPSRSGTSARHEGG
jgi:hypothetical protein